jgi:hypothetical protein
LNRVLFSRILANRSAGVSGCLNARITLYGIASTEIRKSV